MSGLKIAVSRQPAHYQPGEEITGAVQWQLKHAPKSMEVRLLWHTSGRGNEDICVVQRVQFDTPLQEDTRSFSITAPEAPYSFTGNLITLEWALELVALPSNDSTRMDIVIAPEGMALDLRKSTGV